MQYLGIHCTLSTLKNNRWNNRFPHKHLLGIIDLIFKSFHVYRSSYFSFPVNTEFFKLIPRPYTNTHRHTHTSRKKTPTNKKLHITFAFLAMFWECRLSRSNTLAPNFWENLGHRSGYKGRGRNLERNREPSLKKVGGLLRRIEFVRNKLRISLPKNPVFLV